MIMMRERGQSYISNAGPPGFYEWSLLHDSDWFEMVRRPQFRGDICPTYIQCEEEPRQAGPR